jgi:serine/threonine-protein kinase
MVSDPFGLSGQMIDGQYRIERMIGEGGFSVVYRGLHMGLGEPIAVKCLKLHPTLDSDTIDTFLRRFRDEGRLLYRLSQGNLDIVRSITSGTTVSPLTGALIPYMVLEWLEGRSLGADFRERRAKGLRGRPVDEVVDMFESAAYALDHAHRQGVVHRDVKPGNLFLTLTREGAVRMKVLDFGLAKIMDDTIGITLAATVGNFMMCSPRYAAPEQFDPKIGPIGPWTDVYSLGLVMLEALRDERVRKSEGIAQCAVEALDPFAPTSAHALGIKLPSRMELALGRAVALDIRTRQQTAGELFEEILASTRRRMRAAAVPSSGDSASGAPTSRSAPPTLAGPPPTNLGGTIMLNDAPPRPSAAPMPAARHSPWPGRTLASAGQGAPPQPAPQPSPMQPPTPTALAQTPLAPLPAGAAFAVQQAPPMAFTPMPPLYSPPPRQPHVWSSAPPPALVQPTSPTKPARGGLVVLIVLLISAGVGAGGLFGYRLYRAHHATAPAP